MSKIKKIILILIILLALIIFTIYYLMFIQKRELNTSFYIEKGEGYKKMVNNLKKQHIINSKIIFNLYSLFGKENIQNIQAGKYIFMGEYTMPEIFNVIENNAINDNKVKNITIIEGWNKYDVAKYLSQEFNIDYYYVLDFIKTGYKKTNLVRKYNFISYIDVVDLEGFIYPDTYQIFENSTLETIFDKILFNFQSKTEKYNLSNEELYKAVRVASLIEEEAKLDEDRPLIASVIYNRLNNNMKLQIDATIIYFSQDRNNITKYKNVDNPYNTYYNYGLPIGAISNPSIKSIDAAINPAKTDYLYYVNRKDGKAIFANTLEEHNNNIKQYLIQ